MLHLISLSGYKLNGAIVSKRTETRIRNQKSTITDKHDESISRMKNTDRPLGEC